MYRAMDIAQYIINYAIELGKPISNLKLQKILYYVQGALLLKGNDSFIEDEIYNWRHGPVMEEVYSEYRKYGRRLIDEKVKGYSIYEFNEDLDFVKVERSYDEIEAEILDCDKILIKDVVDLYIKYNAWELVEKTHLETPWKETDTNDVITKENIRKFFESKQ